MEVSKHAKERLRERFGFKKRSALRHAEKAFKDGVYPHLYHIRSIGMKFHLMQEKRNDVMYLFYRDMLHVFGWSDSNQPILVTVYDPLLMEPESYYKGGELRRMPKQSVAMDL